MIITCAPPNIQQRTSSMCAYYLWLFSKPNNLLHFELFNILYYLTYNLRLGDNISCCIFLTRLPLGCVLCDNNRRRCYCCLCVWFSATDFNCRSERCHLEMHLQREKKLSKNKNKFTKKNDRQMKTKKKLHRLLLFDFATG